MGLNFEELKLGGMLEKHAKAPWNILTISAYALIQRDVQERRDDKVPELLYAFSTVYYKALNFIRKICNSFLSTYFVNISTSLHLLQKSAVSLSECDI